MGRIGVFLFLFASYVLYSSVVYTKGTENNLQLTNAEWKKVDHGKQLFQEYNCISCHQLYGLGGYLGPELTTAYSDKNRGEQLMRIFLKAGGYRMPNFHLHDEEINDLISYLKYIDSTATTYKTKK
jgi:nitric oxide reductase subunit C